MKNLSAILMLCLFLVGVAKAETEPNDSKAQANSLTLAVPDAGTVTLGESDWFAVTTSEDGDLHITLTSSHNTYIQIFDNDGVISMLNNYAIGTVTRTVNGLAAGTYYVRLYNYFASQTSGYTVTATLTPTGILNDVEDNGSVATASILPLNGNTSGHVNYYYNNQRDTSDWYAVTVNQDGILSYTITSNGQNLYGRLYDGDGITQLAGNYTSGTATYTRSDLAPGVYYIRLNTYYASEYIAYTISNTLTPPVNANDSVANETPATANVFPINSATTGHIGYRYNGSVDGVDWYSVTTNGDGHLSWTIAVDNGQNVYAQLFDGDATTLLAGNYTSGTATYSKDGLAQGTYYLRIRTYYASEFASYQLSNILTEPAQANDVAPNDSFPVATSLALNSTVTGHIGYAYIGNDDLEDWYSITTTDDGQIALTITSHNGQNVYARLYDGDGTTYLAGNYTSGTAVYTQNGLAAGTYYVKINTYYGSEFAPYTLTNTVTYPAQSNDVEPNGTPATGVPYTPGSTVTGHIGYAYFGNDDLVDWYAVTLPGDGKFTWTITSNNGQNVYARLYDNNGTTLLGGNYTSGTATYTENNLAAGTYYLKINNYYDSEFSPYTLGTSLEQMNFAAENPADNNFAITPTILPANTPTTGHLNFYFNGVSDNRDWWVIGYDGTGPLSVTCELEQNHFDAGYPDIAYVLYADTNAAALASGTWLNPTNTINLASPAIRKYYLRLTQSAGTFGAYRLTAAYTENCANAISINSSSQSVPCLGSITYTVSNGLADYTVQLYKDGSPFGATQTTASSVTYNNLSLGTYHLRSYSFGGSGVCNNVSGNTVFAAPPVPNITPGGATTFCAGDSVTLTADAASSYFWSNGATTQSINVTTSGNYVVTVYNAALCSNVSAATVVTVNANPATPVITPTGPLAFCASSSVLLTSSVESEYDWSNGATTQSITVTSAATFTVTVTNANGCSAVSNAVTTSLIPLQTFYRDFDNDTYGNAAITVQDCSAPVGYVGDATDCNDNNIAIHPNAPELCNGLDDDCDTQVDEGCGTFTHYDDDDGDTFGDPVDFIVNTNPVPPTGYVSNNLDCNDGNSAINPSATEICDNIDNDCDGQTDEGVTTTYYADADNDGFGDVTTVQQGCSVPSGYVLNSSDCDDGSNTVYPGALEVCNSVDDDCDGDTDEGCGDCINPSTVTASSDQSICAGSSASISASIGGGATMATWTSTGTGSFLPDNTTLNATYVPSVADIINGSVRLYITTDALLLCATATDSLDITILQLPVAPGAISGQQYVCNPSPPTVFNYTIAAVPGATGYIWTVPLNVNIVSGQGTTTLGVRYNTAALHNGITGSICVSATFGGTCGNSAATCLPISIQSVAPVTPGSISGPAKACPGDTAVYSIASVARAAFYTWSAPVNATIVSGQGTLVVQIAYGAGFNGGTLSVMAGNGCGNSVARTRGVLFNLLPSPGSITGQASGVCNEQNVMYSIAAVTGATSYLWNAPVNAAIDGANNALSVMIDYGAISTGSISVAAVNGCGAGSFRNLSIAGAPASAGPISGPTTVCTGETEVYQVSTVTGAVTYTWTVPGGTTILSGQGTKIINLKYSPVPASNMIITVKTSNTCGTSAVKILNMISSSICIRTGDNDESGLSIYPNPTADYSKLEFITSEAGEYTVELVDVTGRTVYTRSNIASEGINTLMIDLNEMPIGIYLLNFRMGEQSTQMRLIKK